MSPLRDVSRCIGTFTWGAAATAVGFSAYAIITLSAPMPEPISPPIAGLASSARQRFLLEVSPSRVALGELKAGQSARAEITLRNPGLALLPSTVWCPAARASRCRRSRLAFPARGRPYWSSHLILRTNPNSAEDCR